MPNQQLIDYIKKARESGMSDGSIRTELLNVGWRAPDIDAQLNGAVTPPPIAENPGDFSRGAPNNATLLWAKYVFPISYALFLIFAFSVIHFYDVIQKYINIPFALVVFIFIILASRSVLDVSGVKKVSATTPDVQQRIVRAKPAIIVIVIVLACGVIALIWVGFQILINHHAWTDPIHQRKNMDMELRN